ncbi:MAG: hypothetical protein CMM01_05320 [Rhodopirellula sp.]|nr:hypothetical protein [Rhodopirellula sp.]
MMSVMQRNSRSWQMLQCHRLLCKVRNGSPTKGWPNRAFMAALLRLLAILSGDEQSIQRVVDA